MRLITYLRKTKVKIITESKVKATDADVFLTRYAPIFMYNYKVGLLYAVYNKTEKIWKCYKNGNELKANSSNRESILASRITDSMSHNTEKYFTHYHLYRFFLDLDEHDFEKIYIKGESTFVRGRISPDGKTIYIHDLSSRAFSGGLDKFNKWMDKAVDLVYKYMDRWIK